MMGKAELLQPIASTSNSLQAIAAMQGAASFCLPVMCLVSMSKIGSTEIMLLVFGKGISAVRDYIVNSKDSKDNPLHSKSKRKIVHSPLLIS